MAEIGINITVARKLLDQGKLVAIPTETVYGLAANALDPNAVLQIFEVKERPFFDPLIVHIGTLDQLSGLVTYVPKNAKKLAEKFWPGPLTLVLPKNSVIPDLVTGGLPTVAIRMPNHKLTLELLQSLSYPLAAPSANPFGYVSPTTVQHVEDQLGTSLPYILDGGDCTVGVESTIIAFEADQPRIYRVGGIPIEAIRAEIGPVTTEVEDISPMAPGMLPSHYAPGKKLLLGHIPTLLEQYKDQTLGLLTFQQQYPGVPKALQIQLSPLGNLSEAAKNLFASLRKLDAMPITYILAEPVPEEGLGRAINDRLRRASS